jgi:hypothetical protein
VLTTRIDRTITGLPPGEGDLCAEHIFFMCCVVIDGFVVPFILSLFFPKFVFWFLLWGTTCLFCRFSQGEYYHVPELVNGYYINWRNLRVYTLFGAVINYREIFSDNWGWLLDFGANELRRREQQNPASV